MPATRRSPARPAVEIVDNEEPLPLASIMQELALLRKSMETKFTKAEKNLTLLGELVGMLDTNDRAVSDLAVLAVTDVTLSVDENQRAIHEVRAEVERREVELPGKVKAIVQNVLDRNRERLSSPGPRHRPLRTPNPRPAQDRTDPINPGSDSAYFLARQSLRLWPVSREGNLDTRTREFLVNELLLDQQYASSLGFTVKRTAGPARARDREPSISRVRDEVLVVFETIRERDDVRGHTKNLEKKGRGLRLEIPDNLWPSFRVLQGLGYELKQKKNALGRNVLFDDVAKDLKLDFSDDGTNWKTVTPAEARKSLAKCRPARTKKASVSAAELDQLLGESEQTDDNNMSVNEEY